MSVANTSQLLIKNLSLLGAKHPLFINLPSDQFLDEYKTTFPDADIQCFTSHYGTHIAHQARGLRSQFSHVYRGQKIHDIVIILFPKSKAELAYTLAMLNDVVDENTVIYFVGEKNSGVKSVEKLSKGFLQHCQKDDAARHCMLFSGCFLKQSTPFDEQKWFTQYSIDVNGESITVFALPGVFSQEKLDVGTRLLLEHLPDYDNCSLLDFGCGSGVIAAFITQRFTNVKPTLADVSALAIASAQKTFSENGLSGKFIATDSMSNITGVYDNVISNPPFHQGLKTHYQATESFLAKISKHISNKGSLTIVANSFLKYQPIMEQHFGGVSQLTKSNGFTIYQAKR